MGMFDSFYDAFGCEYQTKAFDCRLRKWQVGDRVGDAIAEEYQVQVLGPDGPDLTFVRIRQGVVVEVPDKHDPTLPTLLYMGGWESPPLAPSRLSTRRETRVVWDDQNVPPGVRRTRDGKEYLDERELTDEVVRELGGMRQERQVTPWKNLW